MLVLQKLILLPNLLQVHASYDDTDSYFSAVVLDVLPDGYRVRLQVGLTPAPLVVSSSTASSAVVHLTPLLPRCCQQDSEAIHEVPQGNVIINPDEMLLLQVAGADATETRHTRGVSPELCSASQAPGKTYSPRRGLAAAAAAAAAASDGEWTAISGSTGDVLRSLPAANARPALVPAPVPPC